MSIVTAHGLRLDVGGFSEQGPRPENQDAFAVSDFADSRLLALADGMGGEKSGRVAAETALTALGRAAPIRSIDAARRAVREADENVTRTSAADPETFGGMGCALGFLSLASNGDGPGWIAAHVGDVRILSLSPDGVLRLETRDHTPAFARWEAGEISLDEIPDTVGANRLQRAVGRGGEADVAWLPAAPGWSWLIISDGVYKAMRLDELADAMAQPTAEGVCAVIRAKVADRGADDNYTAVVARVLGTPNAVPPTAADFHAGPVDAHAMTTMNDSRRNVTAGIAVVLALLALALGGFAAWTAWTSGGRSAELDRLRAEVDSLRAIVSELTAPDPFGPTVPEPMGPSTTPPAAGQR